MSKIKAAIVGAGNISASHIRALMKLDDVEIVGVADLSSAARERVAAEHGLPVFPDAVAMMEAARPDYVTICTPHYSHGDITLDALKRGIHVFVEKPMAVEACVAERCIALATERGLTLGVNFSRRAMTGQQKMVEFVRSGFVGDLIHARMTAAKRFRTMAYYRSSSWRATWGGEGGGVLVNQAPHDLDFLIWALGLPARVLADLETIGHDIEVDDNVTALLKWPNGATGSFYASTAVTPGCEVFEIIGTKGTLRLENNILTAIALAEDSRKMSDSNDDDDSAKPKVRDQQSCDLPKEGNHLLKMHRSFIAAMRERTPFLCPAEEGIKEVQLANAMLVSGIRQQWISLPCNQQDFRAILDKLIETRSMAQTREWAASALQPTA